MIETTNNYVVHTLLFAKAGVNVMSTLNQKCELIAEETLLDFIAKIIMF